MSGMLNTMLVKQADMSSLLQDVATTSDAPKTGDKINIDVGENVKSGTCCPRCKSYLCVPRKFFEPEQKSELLKVCVGLCSECGYNPYGKPFKKRITTPDRNALCSCGSGKKYKKCCMNATKHLGKAVADAVIKKMPKEAMSRKTQTVGVVK